MHSVNWNTMCERYGLNKEALDKQIEASGLQPSDGTWLAGGALRRTIAGKPLTSDLDFFFRDQGTYDHARLLVEAKGLKLARENDFNQTWHAELDGKVLPVQLIKNWFYEDAERLIDSFDFTICQLAFDGEQLYLGPFTLWDIARHRLTMHKVNYGASTVRRLLKYTKQGYTACQGTFVTLLKQIADDPSRIQGAVEYVN